MEVRKQSSGKKRLRSTVQPCIDKYMKNLEELRKMEGVYDDDDVPVVADFDPDDQDVNATWEQAQALVQG